MRNPPFHAILYAGVLSSIYAFAGPAAAGDWCSVHLKTDSMVDCGYSTYAECQQKTGGKNAVCIPDPDHAELNTRLDKIVG